MWHLEEENFQKFHLKVVRLSIDWGASGNPSLFLLGTFPSSAFYIKLKKMVLNGIGHHSWIQQGAGRGPGTAGLPGALGGAVLSTLAAQEHV